MPRNSQIINPQFPTDDVVVIDYNVLDYGADPNSVNDSTRAIQRAIDDCYQTGGGTVWLPAGTYKVSSTLYVRAFVTLRGDWRDPDSGSGSYGTVIRAELASSETCPGSYEKERPSPPSTAYNGRGYRPRDQEHVLLNSCHNIRASCKPGPTLTQAIGRFVQILKKVLKIKE